MRIHAAGLEVCSPAGYWIFPTSAERVRRRERARSAGWVASVPRACSPAGARILVRAGPAGLEDDGRGGGGGPGALRGTCGVCRDGVGRGLALWEPPCPVAAVVRPGGPGPRRAAARWVSGSSVLRDRCFPRGDVRSCPAESGAGARGRARTSARGARDGTGPSRARPGPAPPSGSRMACAPPGARPPRLRGEPGGSRCTGPARACGGWRAEGAHVSAPGAP